MARKRNSTQAAAAEFVAAVAAEANAGEVFDEAAEEITADVLEGLRRLDQGGNRVTWYVYCDAPTEREGFVEKLRTEQLDEQRFKVKYGPGDYRIVGKQSDGTYVKGSHKTIKISPILADEPRGQGAGDAVTLMREMRAADEARAAKRVEDMKSYATILATPLATLGAALIARRPAIDVAALITALRPQQSTLSEMTAALVNLKQLQADQGGGVEVVLKVLERIQDMPQGGGGGELGWLGFLRDVIKEAAPHAREILGQLGQPKQPALPTGSSSGAPFVPAVMPPPALPRPDQANGASQTPSLSAASPPSSSERPPTLAGAAAESDVLAAVEPWLRRRAADLHEWAASNVDTELCAEMILASVPKPFRTFVTAGELVQLLESADWWDRVKAFHPPLAPYQAWIDDVRQDLIGMLQEEIQQGSPDQTPPAERPQ